MKILKFLFAIAFTVGLVFIAGCGDDIPPSLSLQQQDAKILDENSPWGGPGNVEVLASPAGVDFSGLLSLQVSFSTSGADDWAPTFFTASGAEDFLSANNVIWIWSGSGTDIITLFEASVAELTGVDITDTTLTFSFEVSPSSGGRVSGLDGSYTVRMN